MSKATNIPPIKPKMGAGFLTQFFGGKTFLHCILELIKNARDWGAGMVFIMSALGRDLLRIVDNGDGMDEANRNAFASINLTTAKGPKQSGIFCTGTKQMLFSHATRVEVRTAPKDEPDWVYIFAFGASEYEEMVLAQTPFAPTRVAKDATAWPYPFPFGTEITYTLKNPKSSGILRGERLSEALSARLPLKFRDIVRVDDVPLPPKKIVGQIFTAVEQHPQLGQVVFEIYRPETKTPDDGLWLTAVEVGEVPMRQFFSSLRGVPVRFPPVLLLDEVCGTVSATYLKEHMNENRISVRPSVSDDTRTLLLLRIFQKFAPEIERRLKIAIKSVADDSGDEEIRDLAAICNVRYNPQGTRPPGLTGRGGGEEEVDETEISGGGDDGPEEEVPLRLSWPREVEVGEGIEIGFRFSKETEGYEASDIGWHTDRSRAKNFKRGEKSVTMVASEVGPGVVRADLRGTPFSVAAYYTVVRERIFRLSIPYAEIEAGSELIVMSVNSDKLSGKVQWRIDNDGIGDIEPQGGRVIFRARREGRATITAFDSERSKTWATCEVTVVPSRGRLICVRGQYFEYDVYDAAGSAEFAKPATMIPGGKVHRLVYNRRAHAFHQASEQGWLGQYLRSAVAMEYARFARMELAGARDIDPRDVPGLILEIHNEGYAVLEEIAGGGKK